jgi:hypothetical protein
VVSSIGARQFLGALDLFVEEADRLHQHSVYACAILGSNVVPRDAGMLRMLSAISFLVRDKHRQPLADPPYIDASI